MHGICSNNRHRPLQSATAPSTHSPALPSSVLKQPGPYLDIGAEDGIHVGHVNGGVDAHALALEGGMAAHFDEHVQIPHLPPFAAGIAFSPHPEPAGILNACQHSVADCLSIFKHLSCVVIVFLIFFNHIAWIEPRSGTALAQHSGLEFFFVCQHTVAELVSILGTRPRDAGPLAGQSGRLGMFITPGGRCC